ncbi:MAG: DUF86 domain-containing protein [Bacteroidales bacterium]|nr:DUF86 domain-containing protein [Bacteroidales bacterium]
MDLIMTMSAPIEKPNDFGTSLNGMTIFRACSMSLQYITESFVKIRNLSGMKLFSAYKSVPWKDVFGMRNFLSHQYVEVDAEGIFSTIKNDIPILREVTTTMLKDLESGKIEINKG